VLLKLVNKHKIL